MFRTKQQRKKICTCCPLAKVANIVGDSTILVIVRDLLTGPKRFGDLSEALAGVSTRTITQKLKVLLENELIERIEYRERPPRVEYKLTRKGFALKEITQAMTAYGRKHLC